MIYMMNMLLAMVMMVHVMAGVPVAQVAPGNLQMGLPRCPSSQDNCNKVRDDSPDLPLKKNCLEICEICTFIQSSSS